jgi:hypothetical protein
MGSTLTITSPTIEFNLVPGAVENSVPLWQYATTCRGPESDKSSSEPHAVFQGFSNVSTGLPPNVI